MIGINTMPKKELVCKQYNNKERTFLDYRGFRLGSLKLILEYSFPGFILKIDRNHKELRFDIYLSKDGIDMKEVEKFRGFYGKGFNIILLENSERKN